MRRISVFVLLLLIAGMAIAQEQPLRPVHTYSIVAYDPETKQLGVAVQSHWFAVGQMVPWAEAGVGAVATQSFVDPSYGKLGLDLMRAGKTPAQVVSMLTSSDNGHAVRQVAMVDASGKVAAFTGCNAIVAAGHQVGGRAGVVELAPAEKGCKPTMMIGSNYSVQANLMDNFLVWPAMAKAYDESKGDLAERMMAALEAGQALGGDIRGQQSAALIVVSGKPTGKPWQDRVFDLRVDDAPEPLKELRRLLLIQRAYNHMNAGDVAVEHNDHATALKEYAAAEKLIAGEKGIPQTRLAEMHFWHAVALVNMKRVDEALPVFAKAYALHAPWRELVKRLPKSGLLPEDPKLMERIVAAR